jgi:hypothetical protein
VNIAFEFHSQVEAFEAQLVEGLLCLCDSNLQNLTCQALLAVFIHSLGKPFEHVCCGFAGVLLGELLIVEDDDLVLRKAEPAHEEVLRLFTCLFELRV